MKRFHAEAMAAAEYAGEDSKYPPPCEDLDAPEPECPFHSAGNTGPCNFCEDQ